MGRQHYRQGECARCHRLRTLTGRRLCQSCNQYVRLHDQRHLYPRTTVALIEIVEEYTHPARRGCTFIEVAQELGLKPDSARRQWERARQRGLVA